jgi:ribonuclease Z
MSIQFQVLGEPGRDNCVLVTVDSGQSRSLLLFDCGEFCLSNLAIRDIQAIDAVFFSHFHIDHIAGFDSLFRHDFARDESPLRLFGPGDAGKVLGNRLHGQ